MDISPFRCCMNLPLLLILLLLLFDVAGKVSRTEKFLGACAAGKWVLHKSYMESCRAEHRFVEVSTHSSSCTTTVVHYICFPIQSWNFCCKIIFLWKKVIKRLQDHNYALHFAREILQLAKCMYMYLEIFYSKMLLVHNIFEPACVSVYRCVCCQNLCTQSITEMICNVTGRGTWVGC